MATICAHVHEKCLFVHYVVTSSLYYDAKSSLTSLLQIL